MKDLQATIKIMELLTVKDNPFLASYGLGAILLYAFTTKSKFSKPNLKLTEFLETLEKIYSEQKETENV